MLLALHVDGVFALQQKLAHRENRVAKSLIVLDYGGKRIDDVVAVVVEQDDVPVIDAVGALLDDVLRAAVAARL